MTTPQPTMFINPPEKLKRASIILKSNTEVRTFHENDRVEGHLNIETSLLTHSVSKVVIELKYSEEILCKGSNTFGGIAGNFRMRRNVTLDAFTPSEDVYSYLNSIIAKYNSVKTYYQVPFTLTFPPRFPENRTNVLLQSYLPPSFGAYTPVNLSSEKLSPEIVGDSSLRVSYWVEARIVTVRTTYRYDNNKDALYGYKPLRFSPRLSCKLLRDTLLPSESSSHNYYFLQPLTRSRLLTPKKFGELQIYIENFDNVVALDDETETTEVELSIILKFQQLTARQQTFQVPEMKHIKMELVTCSITSQKTYSGLLSPDSIDNTVSTHMDHYLLSGDILNQTAWQRNNDDRFTTSIKLTCKLENIPALVPTYFTHMSSRQYKLKVEFCFSKGIKPVAILLPLKIVSGALKKIPPPV